MSRRKTCGDCPKRVNGYCTAFAKTVTPMHPPCEYGKRMMYNAYMRKYLAKRRSDAR